MRWEANTKRLGESLSDWMLEVRGMRDRRPTVGDLPSVAPGLVQCALPREVFYEMPGYLHQFESMLHFAIIRQSPPSGH